MPIFLGREAELCEDWFFELLTLRYPDVHFIGDGRKYVATIERGGEIHVQLNRAHADYKWARDNAVEQGILLHSGLELRIEDPARWQERGDKGVVTPHQIRHCQSRLRGLERLLRQIRSDGFEPDEDCQCGFEPDEECLRSTFEDEMWTEHAETCPVYIQGKIDEELGRADPLGQMLRRQRPL